MKLNEAIIKATKTKRKIKNNELNMVSQTAKSLIYWLFIHSNDNIETVQTTIEYLNSNDWELE